ncbi:hypothetical protein IC582_005395 [Cucumis melo]|uniref:Uncharacterized protein LOC103502256 n=1 Tax=Cucumis melo TaxID=3656 RepID=A0A1S3CLD8_CUCME|nr:uncharacterized protein LOC103502256 [Cucumis melo]
MFKAHLRDTQRDREILLSAKRKRKKKTKIRGKISKLTQKKMKDSTEKSKKQADNESDLHPIPHCSIILTIFDSILQAFIAILRFSGFKRNAPPYRPASSSLEDCYTAGSNPPSTAVDPPHDDSEEESEYYRPHVPPPPPWSTGGGGQIH